MAGRGVWSRVWCKVGAALLACAALACESPTDAREPASEPAQESAEQGAALRFSGDESGLLLVWYAADGAPHTAQRVADVPEAQRSRVRVELLDGERGQRPPPGTLFVADLSAPAEDGSYVARPVARETFERALRPEPTAADDGTAGTGDPRVVLYGTSWCGACRQARRFLSQRGVKFEDLDIEADPAARAALQQKARRAGVPTGSVPVIEVDGTLMAGFDPQRLAALLKR